MGTISSLPVTKTVTGVTTDMVCVKMTFGTPSAQTSDWIGDTDTSDQVTISGSIGENASTTLKILLVQQNSVTGS